VGNIKGISLTSWFSARAFSIYTPVFYQPVTIFIIEPFVKNIFEILFYLYKIRILG